MRQYSVSLPMVGGGQYQVCLAESPAIAAEVVRVLLMSARGGPERIVVDVVETYVPAVLPGGQMVPTT